METESTGLNHKETGASCEDTLREFALTRSRVWDIRTSESRPESVVALSDALGRVCAALTESDQNGDLSEAFSVLHDCMNATAIHYEFVAELVGSAKRSVLRSASTPEAHLAVHRAFDHIYDMLLASCEPKVSEVPTSRSTISRLRSSDRELVYRFAFEHHPDPFLVIVDDGLLRQANGAARDLLAAVSSHAEIEGLPIAQFFPQKLLNELEGLDACGRLASEFELDMETSHGVRFYEAALLRVLSPEGSPHCLLLSLRDMTDRRHAEEVAGAQSRLLQSLIDSVVIPISYRDTTGRYLGCNRAFEELVGRTRRELVGRTVVQVHEPVLAEYLRNTDERVITLRSPLTDERVLRDGNGFQHTYLVRKSPFCDLKEQFAGVVDAFQDISELARAQEATANREMYFRTLIDIADSAVMVLGRDRKAKYASQACRNLLQTTVGEDDLYLCEYALPADRQRIRNQLEALLSGAIKGTRFSFTLAGQGSLRPLIEVSATSQLDEPNIDGIVLTLRDMTDRVRSEMELRKARDAAELAARAKSEFLATMSHEIRTPLNGILGMARLLAECDLPDDQREFVETISYSGEALLAMINDILDLSKMEAGMMQVEFIPFELDRLVFSVLELLASRAQEKGLEIVAVIAPEVPRRLVGDPGRLRQVLLNLVGNAVKFTTEGGITVGVSLDPSAPKSAEVRFVVSDTGIGIPDDVQPRLFDKFTQADSSISRRFSGTGLGLAISKRIVDLMGGQIGLHSTLGKGSNFWFKIPFAVRSKSKVHRHSLAGRSWVASCSNPVLEEAVKTAIENLGCSVRQTADPFDALRLLASVAPDRVDHAIIDFSTVGSRLQQLVSLAEELEIDKSRVFWVTSLVKRKEAEDLARVGFTRAIPRPFHEGALLRKLSGANGRNGKRLIGLKEGRKPVTQRATPRRVLLVEDNMSSLKVARAILSREGHHVSVAMSAKEALEELDRASYDVLVTDLQLPDMDGLTMARRIRSSGRDYSNTPMVALTASAMPGDRERCIEAGMNDYVPKPLHPDELADVVARVAGKARSARVRIVSEAVQQVALVDMDILRSFEASLGRAELREILADFRREVKELVAGILEQAAANAPDMTTVKALAHTLKGSCGNFGLRLLYDDARAIHEVSKTGDKIELRSLTANLDERLRQSVETLDGFLDSLN